MLDRMQTEALAFRVVRAVQAGQPVEDASVELKTKWPDDHSRTAFQLAGLANASSGDYVYWLVGVNENTGVVVLEDIEVSNWWNSVRRWFDPPAPRMQNFTTYLDEKPFVVLAFETAARPFVVKTPGGGGRYPFVVPWREGNATRTASRADLISLLVPPGIVPDFDILDFHVQAGPKRDGKEQHWLVYLKIFVHQDPAQVLVIPKHRCACSVDVPEFRLRFDEGGLIRFWYADQSSDDGIVQGPDRLTFRCDFTLQPTPGFALPDHHPTKPIKVAVSMQPANAGPALRVEKQLRPAREEDSNLWGLWTYSGDED